MREVRWCCKCRFVGPKQIGSFWFCLCNGEDVRDLLFAELLHQNDLYNRCLCILSWHLMLQNIKHVFGLSRRSPSCLCSFAVQKQHESHAVVCAMSLYHTIMCQVRKVHTCMLPFFTNCLTAVLCLLNTVFSDYVGSSSLIMICGRW